MDYSKLSDFEINKMVSAFLWGSVCAVDGVVLHNEKDGPFDPCNNPTDAWPIIVKNKIWLREIYGVWDAKGFPDEKHPFNQVGWKDENPLRAAMIAFLMMQ